MERLNTYRGWKQIYNIDKFNETDLPPFDIASEPTALFYNQNEGHIDHIKSLFAFHGALKPTADLVVMVNCEHTHHKAYYHKDAPVTVAYPITLKVNSDVFEYMLTDDILDCVVMIFQTKALQHERKALCGGTRFSVQLV